MLVHLENRVILGIVIFQIKMCKEKLTDVVKLLKKNGPTMSQI